MPNSATELVSIINNNHYTSLRDILPATPSPPSPLSTVSQTHNSSWHEIPIRDPLLKHAAWAYLQPMSSAPAESSDAGILRKLKSALCCGEVGCFEYFKDMVLRILLKRVDSDDEYEDEDEEDGFWCGGGNAD